MTPGSGGWLREDHLYDCMSKPGVHMGGHTFLFGHEMTDHENNDTHEPG
jgi:hypothetical protein